MHPLSFLYPALLVASGAEALRSAPKVKLSNVQSLTLRKDLQTSHRRVSSIPQVRLKYFNFPPKLISVAQMHRRLRPRPLRRGRNALQERGRRLRREQHPMDLYRLAP